jgi:SMODS and SLOG-associating 2TM effector domain 1
MPVNDSHLPQFHVVGFTGHRQLADPARAKAFLADALESLQQQAAGEWIGLSSVALGSDALFAHHVLERKIAWQALLPFQPAEFRKDFDAKSWAEVEGLLARAESVTVLGGDGEREEAYLDCGIETVNACDVLIALWDGEPARGRGGTAEVVTYARELSKPLIVIDPVTGALRREHFQHFRPKDPELAFLNGLPEALPPATPAAGARGRVERFQLKADRAANRGAPRFRTLRASIVLLEAAATIAATAGLAFDWHPLFVSWTKLSFLLASLGAAIAIQYYQTQHTFVRCRLAAEIGRAALATWGMPRRAALFEDLELPEFRQLMRSLHMLHRRGASDKRPNLDTFCQSYRAERINDQLRYYRRRLDHAAPQLARLRFGFIVSTLVAILCAAVYALHATLRIGELNPAFVVIAFHFLPIVLPMVAASFIALISINDLHRRVARYREMCHMLEAAHKQIVVTHTWHSLEHLVRRTERALLQEVLEWHTLMSHLEAH